jgi:TRAP-type transport system periplasmic protein
MKKFLLPLFVIILLAGLVVSGCSKETTKIELKYGSLVSPPHIRAQVDQMWIDRMNELTKGQLVITPFWGATLISNTEALDEISKGVADLGYIEPGSSKTGCDIHKGVQGFYFGISDLNKKLDVYMGMIKDIPQAETEISDLVKVLGRHPGSNYQLVSTKPVRSIADFKGLKVKAVGSFQNVFKALGGEGINMPMGEAYMGLEKGTIDALCGPYETLKSWNFGEIAKYVINVNLNGTPVVARVMNLDVWNKLPKNIQKIIDNNVDWYTDEQIKLENQANQDGYNLGKTQGVEYIDLPPAEWDKFTAVVEQVMLAEAAKLDAKGLPGTQVYDKVRELAAE